MQRREFQGLAFILQCVGSSAPSTYTYLVLPSVRPLSTAPLSVARRWGVRRGLEFLGLAPFKWDYRCCLRKTPSFPRYRLSSTRKANVAHQACSRPTLSSIPTHPFDWIIFLMAEGGIPRIWTLTHTPVVALDTHIFAATTLHKAKGSKYRRMVLRWRAGDDSLATGLWSRSWNPEGWTSTGA